MLGPAQIVGAVVLAVMAIVFGFLQEDKSLGIFSLSSIHIGKINEWIARKLHTSTQVVIRVEIGAVSTLGFTLMQIGEWAGAMACWVVLGIILFSKALAWEGTQGRAGITALLRLLSAMGAIAVSVLMITITGLRKPENEPWSNLQELWKHKVVAQALPPEAPLTLESLFRADFPNLMKFTISADPVVFENGESVNGVVSQEYADFPARSCFIGYYIPASDLTFRVCVRLANSSRSLIDELTKRMDVQTFDASGTSLKDLTFSGRVYIYHQIPLTLKQKSVLVDYYSSQHLAVDFRGIEYLQDVARERKLKAQQGK
jgi:hypothetical protein